MNLTLLPDINIELSQKLTLTQEMVQSLEILQLSRGELYDHVYDVMLENPVIDVEMPEQPIAQMIESVDWQDYARTYGEDDFNYYGRNTYGMENIEPIEYSMTSEMTLEENLMSQVEYCDVPYIVESIAVYIIQTLDDNGYMTYTLEEISEELNVSKEMVQEALELIWTFDPAGIGARDLTECLQLQLKYIDRYNDDLKLITEKHLEDIAGGRFEKVARTVGTDVETVMDYAELLRSLEPKPGRAFASVENTRYIVPDVIVEPDQGKFSVRLKSSAAPKVIIREEYRRMLKEADKNSHVADFLSGRFDSAMWLIRCIEQRNNTILKVAEAVTKRQHRFMLHGRRYLEAVTMKEIADELGIHESTVSRAVSGKYMQCPQGTVELKKMFVGSSKLKSDDGSFASSDALKTMIKSMVELEDVSKPLSDKSIADAISVSGIQISRRTVAKYRDEMGIPSSSRRRKKIR